MNALRVAPLQPVHRPRIEDIVRATGVFTEDEVQVALEVFDATDDYEFLGAFDGETLVGYTCFGATPSTDRTFDVYWIAVHPDAQRSGAGAFLMSAVEEALHQRQARMVVIETSSRDDYAPTRRFYHKHGYIESARLRDFYARGDDRVVFTKRVAGPAVLPQPA